jgi:hypothetical protein
MIAPQETDPEVLAAIEQFKKKFPHPCGLCGQSGSDGIAGVYKPPTRDLSRFGIPKGKDGYLIYRLCPSCAQIPDYPRRIEEKLEATYFNRGNLDLNAAVEAYSKGTPVIVYTPEGGVIHGRETMKVIIDTGAALECVAIHGVSVDDWNNSDWPEVLEAARQVFMQQGGFKLQRAGEIRKIDDDE